jgi:hypothetical protein
MNPAQRSDQDWTSRRDEAFAAQAAALARAGQAEQVKAEGLLAQFVQAAQAAGIVPQPLKATARSGGARCPTDVTGWYLRRDGSIGCSPDGQYYILQVDAGPFGRWRRHHLEPSPAPLVVGRGGRDGDVIDLKDLLAVRLEAGHDWP